MQAARVEPNLITYNALIHACAQVGATDAAFQVWHQLRADGRTNGCANDGAGKFEQWNAPR